MHKVAVLKFPGTNCDYDTAWALKTVDGLEPHVVWYEDFTLRGWDAVILPGGFSYGDYLRAGAIAARTKVMEEVARAVDEGVPVLGICNGFQMLVESGLLPGALLGNDSGSFICRWVKLRVERPRGPWMLLLGDGQELCMPIAHAEGRYFVDEGTYMKELLHAPLIRYAEGWNPNGSVHDIAGVASVDGLVLGLMPHPERASEEVITPRGYLPDGRLIFQSLAVALRRGW